MLIHSGMERTTSKPLQHAPQAMQFQESTYFQGTGFICSSSCRKSPFVFWWICFINVFCGFGFLDVVAGILNSNI